MLIPFNFLVHFKRFKSNQSKIITDRVRSLWGRLCFTDICLFTGGGAWSEGSECLVRGEYLVREHPPPLPLTRQACQPPLTRQASTTHPLSGFAKIRSSGGPYACYWNALLFCEVFHK